MRGAHATRAVLLMVSCCCSPWASAGQQAVDPPGRAAVRAAGTLALQEGDPVRMPGGLASLCQRDASFCAPAPGIRQAMHLTPAQTALLGRVNAAVNHTIASTTDRKLYGKDEYWSLPTSAGDCEDYVLLKRRMLIRAGLPEALLLITVVHDENDEGHAVLSVPTEEGDLVLDNRRDEILHWWETGYRFIKRQSERAPAIWVSLGNEKLQATDIASGPALP
jgi:predicted transglutaminase-like cysteine proteinase